MTVLFLTEAELVDEMFGQAHYRQGRILFTSWMSQRSFPRVVRGTNLYYAPAVRAWVQGTYGLPAADGKPQTTYVGLKGNWDEPTTKGARRPRNGGPGVATKSSGLGSDLAADDEGAAKPALPTGNDLVDGP